MLNCKSLVTFQLFLSAFFQQLAIAQPQPDPSIWMNLGEPNPNGEYAVPLVIYNSDTGILSIDTLGLNGVDDTPDYTTEPGPIGGDDVALYGLMVDWIPSVPHSSDFRILESFDGMVVHNRLWFGVSNGSFVALDSVSLGGNLFLWPGIYDVAQIPIGLTNDNFFDVIINTNPTGRGGGHRSDRVEIVPEPDLISLGLGLFLFVVF